MYKYLVVFEKTENGYNAFAPDLPGCAAAAKDKKNTKKLIYEAIKFHLEGLARENEQIPAGNAESEVLIIN